MVLKFIEDKHLDMYTNDFSSIFLYNVYTFWLPLVTVLFSQHAVIRYLLILFALCEKVK